ncbi:MAG: gamma carbonic anhydrase family protein [Bacteriovoracaceae bacterium]|nr:gamma carbonic anhydrase family protein [Bacteriovoracaceae bacterium]
MSLYEYKGKKPLVGSDCFIADGAHVIGEVEIGNNSSVWFNTVIRGDMAEIRIGENTNIQDLCMLHVDTNTPLTIGNGVTVGHHAVLHACTIGDNTLIGMGAVVLDNAQIGKNSVVAAGAVVPPGKKYPDNSLIMGTPAKVKRELNEQELKSYGFQYTHYLKEKDDYGNPDVVRLLLV